VSRTVTGTIKRNDVLTVTFTLSEASSNFELADVSVTNGSLSNWSRNVSGTVYTATLTASANGPSWSIAAGAFSDAAGNTNAAASANF
jgi:hypothetical protein